MGSLPDYLVLFPAGQPEHLPDYGIDRGDAWASEAHGEQTARVDRDLALRAGVTRAVEEDSRQEHSFEGILRAKAVAHHG